MNVGDPNFKFGGKATKPKFISNYVNLTPSEPATNHKFREVAKQRWVGGDMRLC